MHMHELRPRRGAPPVPSSDIDGTGGDPVVPTPLAEAEAYAPWNGRRRPRSASNPRSYDDDG